jgi:hypothetical protein
MKTYEAIAALEALNKIAQADTKTPLKFAYAAARNRRELGEFVTAYEASRKALLNQYGTKKEDGELDIDEHGNVKLVDKDAFAKGMTELHEQDVADLKVHQVALADFPAEQGPQGLEVLTC